MCKCADVQMCKFFYSITLNKCDLDLVKNVTPDAFAHLLIF